MKLVIKTAVAQPPQQVWEGFNQDLFTSLAPPFPPVKLLRFDGSMKGDEVHLELNFLLFKQQWNSLIVGQASSEQEFFFVDEGIKLPFFLKFWQHKHRMVKEGNGTMIIDDITYQTPFKLLDWLMYPAMWAQFAYRKPIYKKIFS